jgi:hypothetical protein
MAPEAPCRHYAHRPPAPLGLNDVPRQRSLSASTLLNAQARKGGQRGDLETRHSSSSREAKTSRAWSRQDRRKPAARAASLFQTPATPASSFISKRGDVVRRRSRGGDPRQRKLHGGATSMPCMRNLHRPASGKSRGAGRCQCGSGRVISEPEARLTGALEVTCSAPARRQAQTAVKRPA